MPSKSRALLEEFENLNPRLVFANVLTSLLPRLSFCRLRTTIYRLAGFRIGPGTVLLGRLTLSGPGAIQKRLHIGANCVVNGPLFIDLSAEVWVGDRVSIGHHTVFVTAHHEVGPAHFRAGCNTPRPIRVESGSWIAARSTLLPGITVGESAVVASGSVVRKDVPGSTLVGGVPARLIRPLE